MENNDFRVELAELKTTVSILTDNVKKLFHISELMQASLSNLSATKNTIDWKSAVLFLGLISAGFGIFIKPLNVEVENIIQTRDRQQAFIEKLFERDQQSVIDRTKLTIQIKYLEKELLKTEEK